MVLQIPATLWQEVESVVASTGPAVEVESTVVVLTVPAVEATGPSVAVESTVGVKAHQ